MKIDIHESPDLLVAHIKDVEAAFRKAVHSALIEHKRAGAPIAVWKDGKAQFISAEDIIIEPLETAE